MNLKGISVLVGITAVILMVVLFPIKAGDVPPAIIDNTEIVDEAAIDKESNIKDVPGVADSAVLKNKTGLDWYIDENGTKHYRLEVRDVPKFEG